MIVSPKKRYILLKKQSSSGGGSSASVDGTVIIQGYWDMSNGLFPSVGVTTSQILRGYQWKVNVSGGAGGVDIDSGAKITAWVNTPGQTVSNWDIIY